MARILASVLLLGLLSPWSYAEVLRLALPHFPPYTYMQAGKPQGLGVDRVSRALDRAGLAYEFVATSNYASAYIELKRGLIDGFFLASQNHQRDVLAQFSEALVTNKWSWIFKAGQSFDPHAPGFLRQLRVGTYKGTNTHRWLTQNHYHVVGQAGDLKGLLHMLDSGRIDTIFLAEAVFWQTLDELGGRRDDYVAQVEIAKPFGIYIAKSYLQAHPETMSRLNAAIRALDESL